MIIGSINTWVGEHVPIQYSFLNSLLSFLPTVQTLTGASISWTSQSPSLATFDASSQGLVTSSQAAAQGIANDACIGRFNCLAAGVCTVQVTVAAVNPVATYVGVVQILIQVVPTP